MSYEKEFEVHVDEIATKIECESCCILKDKGAGIHGGIALTGFIDVEKLITVKYNHKKEKQFLEKNYIYSLTKIILRRKRCFK
ncbi:hypothetical protein BK742_03860 [Bacillus thuringiensis serovar pingluonsis]|uniref:Uncharacterized protein n=1 Tax=Bacillus thuringiensis serovar pingluonsis TaxID=180881 RepID=A0A243BM78_BACTU|nr:MULTISPECIES: hypothetical protein [Bacillus cereus group]MEB9684690.1 hypothetical protein [Bacillus anthracis]OTY48277.1 hypothetical protein BK742_03860 [Bacillus thuringiensis serovar pingluonsis]